MEITSIELPGSDRPLDTIVARLPVAAGQALIDIPEKLVISLDRIFESEFVAELLTNDKLSELAILTLYLMYEKKTGKESFWAPYIQVRPSGYLWWGRGVVPSAAYVLTFLPHPHLQILDRQRGRGAQAVESPLLWQDSELEDLLQGEWGWKPFPEQQQQPELRAGCRPHS